MRTRALMTIVAVAGVLAVASASAPAGEPAARPAAGASSAKSALRLHYRYVYLGRYRSAWALLTPAAKRERGSYTRWRAGYSDTGQVTVYSIREARTGDSERRRLAFGLTACRGDMGGTIEERFSGGWPARRVRGRWYLDRDARITRRSSERVTRCNLPLP